ncbi:CRISP [Mactra antiquata]
MADKKFIDEMVKAHNEYRSRHQASSIKHAKDLSEFAQKWADHLVATNSFQHSNCELKGERLGENIAMKWSSQPDAYSGQEATDQWYSEVKMHTFGGEPSSLATGHFTQVVWKGSKEMGVGKALAKDGKTIVVASYRPAGNMVGKFSENVLPPKDGKIILPVTKDSSGGGSGPFASRFEEGRRGFGDMGGASGGGKETKTTRTITRTEGGVTKTIVEETIIKADGSKVTTTRETTTTAGTSGPFSSTDEQFGKLSLGDSEGKKKDSKSKHKRRGSSSSSSSSSDDEKSKKKPQKMKDFIDEAVKVHNELRAKHGVSKLKHAKDLSEYAQKWAEHLAAKDAFQHSDCMHKGERLGENICCKWSSAGADYTGKEACEQWYSEISKHDFSSEPRTLGSGHFTQMVWKGSKEMGIGKAKTSGGKAIVVASYRPAGNMVGQFVENVPPLKK